MKEIGDLSVILVGTEYEDSIPCIQTTFDAAGIKTINELDNAPRVLGMCMCGYDTYPLLSVVRERTFNPPPQPKKKVVKPVRTKKKVEVKESQPEKVGPKEAVEEDQGTKE